MIALVTERSCPGIAAYRGVLDLARRLHAYGVDGSADLLRDSRRELRRRLRRWWRLERALLEEVGCIDLGESGC